MYKTLSLLSMVELLQLEGACTSLYKQIKYYEMTVFEEKLSVSTMTFVLYKIMLASHVMGQ